MTAKELKRIFQKGECLSLDTMRLYIDGKLNKKSMHEVEKHLIECGLCTAAMDGLTPRRMAEINKLSSHIERRLAVYMNTPPSVPFFRRYAGSIAAGILLIGAGFTWWYFAHDSSKEKNHLNDTAAVSGNTLNVSQPEIKPELVTNTQQQTDPANSNPGTDQVKNTSADFTSPDLRTAKTQPSDPNQQNQTLPQNNTPPAPDNKTNPDPNSQAATSSPNTRNANQPVRVKSVIVYAPVTHNENKGGTKTAKGGQINKSGGSTASFQLDEMPTYPGGDAALRAYIMNNFKPVTIDRSKVSKLSTGVLFIVNAKTGSISAPELSFSISPEVDAELLRVIKAMPNWNPGKKRGELDIMLGITFE